MNEQPSSFQLTLDDAVEGIMAQIAVTHPDNSDPDLRRRITRIVRWAMQEAATLAPDDRGDTEI